MNNVEIEKILTRWGKKTRREKNREGKEIVVRGKIKTMGKNCFPSWNLLSVNIF